MGVGLVVSVEVWVLVVVRGVRAEGVLVAVRGMRDRLGEGEG